MTWKKKRNNFLLQLERRKQQAAETPPSKPISQMSEQELDQEEARLRAEIRQLRERGVAAARQARDEQESTGTRQLFKRRRPHWR